MEAGTLHWSWQSGLHTVNKMLWAKAALALAGLCRDLKPENLLTPHLYLQEVKFVLNPVLPLYHFLGNLARHVLGDFTIVISLGFKPSLAHFY